MVADPVAYVQITLHPHTLPVTYLPLAHLPLPDYSYCLVGQVSLNRFYQTPLSGSRLKDRAFVIVRTNLSSRSFCFEVVRVPVTYRFFARFDSRIASRYKGGHGPSGYDLSCLFLKQAVGWPCANPL